MEVRYDGQEQAKKTCVYKRTDPGTEAVASVSVSQGNKIKHTQGALTIQGQFPFTQCRLYLGTTTGHGTYEMTGGVLNVGDGNGGGKILIGNGDASAAYAGYFVHSGGEVTTDHLYVGNFQEMQGSASYTLSGDGVLTVINQETIGNAGPGVFTQNGGTHSVRSRLTIGARAPGGPSR